MHGYHAAYGASQQHPSYPGYAAPQTQSAPAAHAAYPGYATGHAHATGYGQHQDAAQERPGYGQPAPQASQRPQHLTCAGCKHETVAQIVRGDFTLHSENHQKPVYKKNGQWNGLDVMIYFWDERDGPGFTGWWFGPKVGGDQVWAYHPDKDPVPPPSGWKVPYDGPVDNTFLLTQSQAAPATAAAAPLASFYPQYAQGYGQQAVWGQPGYASAYDPATAERQRQEQAHQQQMQAEMHRQQQEAQRRLVEQQKQEQLRLKREAEQKAREEQARRQREEQEKMAVAQQAILGVRKVMQMLRLATPETFDEITQKLEKTLETELPKCGAQSQVMKDEANKGLEQAAKRIDMVLEQRKRDQEKKEAEEKKRAEQEAIATEFINELTALLETAEASSEKLKDLGSPLEKNEGATEKELSAIEGIVEAMIEAAKEAKAQAKKCTDYIIDKGPAMKETLAATGPQPAAVQAAQAEKKAMLAKLLQRLGVLDKSTDALLESGKSAKGEAVRKAAAKTKTEELRKKFAKHDKDKDNFLSQAEVTTFVKAELGFQCQKSDLEKIWTCAVKKGERGVSMDNLYLLKASVGIAKELQKNQKRKATREAKEKIVAEVRGKLRSKIKEVEAATKALDSELAKIEQAVAPLLSKVLVTPVPSMLKEADACEKLIQAGHNHVEKVKEKVVAIPDGFDPKHKEDLKEVVAAETKKLQLHMARSDNRLGRARNLTNCYREKASRKTAARISKVRDFTLKLARQHGQENKLSNEQIFEKITKKQKIDEAEFVKFFSSIDQVLKEQEFPEEEATDEAKAEDEGKEGEGKAKPAEEKLKVEKKPVQQVELTEEGLKSFFASVLDAGSKTLSKESFLRIMQVHYKVVKETPLTADLEVGAGSPLRTLKVGEVLELLEGPSKETAMKVFRAKIKSHKDGEEGWATIAGNAGTAFLEEGGHVYKACANVALTESAEEQESTNMIREGDVMEVLEWPTKSEESSLLRMKVKTRIGGKIGWITQVDEEGKVLADVV